MAIRILWIERSRWPGPSFVSGLLQNGYLVDVAPTGKAALFHPEAFSPDMVVMKAASLRTSGRRICQTARSPRGVPRRMGAIALYPRFNLVRVEGGRARHLTPRLTALLQTLMQRPGEVVDREMLFRCVWRTDCVGDTRKLDVHISWLRKKIEEDPRRPRLLQTVSLTSPHL